MIERLKAGGRTDYDLKFYQHELRESRNIKTMRKLSWFIQGSTQQDYRNKQAELIKQGKFDDAFMMDINDIQSKFGNKYDEAILEAMDALP